MPHVGGGSSGGGGHSSSSGAHSSAPRYDNHGNLHSPYYVRPGFYYRGRYVPYEAKKRKSALYAGPIASLVFAFILCLVTIFIFTSANKYDQDKLEEYALNHYSEVYDTKSSSYEYNILVTFVAYEDDMQFDFVSIVGDNVNTYVDVSFGFKGSLFGDKMLEYVSYDHYYSNLYTNIAKAVDSIVGYMPDKVYNSNEATSKIVNKTDFGPVNGEAELILAEQKFYEKTGYHISFLIDKNTNVYKLEVLPLVIVYGISALLVAISIGGFITSYKTLKEVEGSIKDGNPSKYFEGEDDFETYYNEHPFPTNVNKEE